MLTKDQWERKCKDAGIKSEFIAGMKIGEAIAKYNLATADTTKHAVTVVKTRAEAGKTLKQTMGLVEANLKASKKAPAVLQAVTVMNIELDETIKFQEKFDHYESAFAGKHGYEGAKLKVNAGAQFLPALERYARTLGATDPFRAVVLAMEQQINKERAIALSVAEPANHVSKLLTSAIQRAVAVEQSGQQAEYQALWAEEVRGVGTAMPNLVTHVKELAEADPDNEGLAENLQEVTDLRDSWRTLSSGTYANVDGTDPDKVKAAAKEILKQARVVQSKLLFMKVIA